MTTTANITVAGHAVEVQLPAAVTAAEIEALVAQTLTAALSAGITATREDVMWAVRKAGFAAQPTADDAAKAKARTQAAQRHERFMNSGTSRIQRAYDRKHGYQEN